MSLSLKEKTALCYNCALDKQALDITVLDLRGISDVADVFMIASSTSIRHAQAIVDEIEKGLREAGEKTYHIEGYHSPKWILIDEGDLVVHVFSKDAREYYGMERLWIDAIPFDMDSAA
ncbi:Ribosomal silencing factor RsfA (former Iojap) [hydrothermal vent metagenome]|uniref:Ribosomal silencing factor RsfA (Former Iojap) n=1 Tax=hydrothermal vent metagenome TaxID=652676 RepID=A0A3B1CQH8_9ZZZZ